MKLSTETLMDEVQWVLLYTEKLESEEESHARAQFGFLEQSSSL